MLSQAESTAELGAPACAHQPMKASPSLPMVYFSLPNSPHTETYASHTACPALTCRQGLARDAGGSATEQQGGVDGGGWGLLTAMETALMTAPR